MSFGDLSRKLMDCPDAFRTQRENHQHPVHDVPVMGHFPIPSNALGGAVLELARPGRRAIRSAAIVLGSRRTDGSFGSIAIMPWRLCRYLESRHLGPCV